MGLDEWEGGWQKGILETVVLCTKTKKNNGIPFIYLFMVSRCIKWFVFYKVYWSTIQSILHFTVGQIWITLGSL